MNSYMVAAVFVLMVLAPALVGSRNTREERPRRRGPRANGETDAVVSSRLLNREGGTGRSTPRVIVVPHHVPVAIPVIRATRTVAAPPPLLAQPQAARPAASQAQPKTPPQAPPAKPYLPGNVRPANRVMQGAEPLHPALKTPAPEQPVLRAQHIAPRQEFHPAPAPRAAAAAAPRQTAPIHPARTAPVMQPAQPVQRPWRETSYAEAAPVPYLVNNPRQPEAQQEANGPVERPEPFRHNGPRIRYMESRREERARPEPQREPAAAYAQQQAAPQTYLVHAPMPYSPSPMPYPPPYGYTYPQPQPQPYGMGYGYGQPMYMPVQQPAPVPYASAYAYQPQAPMAYSYAPVPFQHGPVQDPNSAYYNG